jgi:dihydroflavonol-4-reductase
MKVFLTGGTGFIGQSLNKALFIRGWSITALVRKPDSPQAQALSKIGVQLAKEDVTQHETMRSAMIGVEIVVHNAGQYELGMDSPGKQRMHLLNVDGIENVLSLAHELKIARTIHVSTVQVFGETGRQLRDETFTRQVPCRTNYEQSKTDAHKIALQYQQRRAPLIIVCPHQVISVNDHSIWGYYQRLFINRNMPPMAFSPN